MGLCGGKNEDNIRRRFLQCFQKSIKRSCRKHVNLVDNVYLIVSFSRTIGHLLTDLTDIVNAVIGRCIDLDHVHGGASLYRLTHVTFTTGTSIYRMLAVYCFCQYFCNGSLTGSSGAAKQIRVTNTVMLDLIGQGSYNVILSLDIVKIIRSELPV